MMFWQYFQIWRLRPGMLLAAKLAEQAAWSHPNAGNLGPEQNLMRLSQRLTGALLDADEGNIQGLCLSPITPLAKMASN